MGIDNRGMEKEALLIREEARKPAEVPGHPHVKKMLIGAAVVLLALVAVGIHQFANGAQIEDLDKLGYPGIFLLMAISGASVFFPIGSQAGVMAAGAIWNPLLVGLAAGLGNATGELTGYAAGRIGAAALHGHKSPVWWKRLQSWLHRYGFFAVVVLAAIPNPVFDVVGLLAGSVGYPAVRQFWLACVVGNTIKYGALAYLGVSARDMWFG